jgi:hypothetical protein
MNDEAPLDLRSLAEVDSPEVVSAALRRWRRRFLTTGGIVLAAAVVFIAALVWAVLDKSPRERIETAAGIRPGLVFEVGDTTIVVRKIADLGDDIGIALVLAAPDAADGVRHYLSTSLSDLDMEDDERATEAWFLLDPPEDGRIEVAVDRERDCALTDEEASPCRSQSRRIGTFVIDLETLDVDRSIWEKGRSE